MKKVILALAVFCTIHVDCLDRRVQNANLDFLNFESNNARTTPKPGTILPPGPGKAPTSFNQDPLLNMGGNVPTSTPKPNPNAGFGLTTGTAGKPGTTVGVPSSTVAGNKPTQAPSNARQKVDQFNNLNNNNQQGNIGGDKLGNPTVNPPRPSPASSPSIPNSPNKNTQPLYPTPNQKPNLAPNQGGGFPALPTSGGPTVKPAASWASVVSGNKNSNDNKPGVVPSSPPPKSGGSTLPSSEYPSLPPIKSASSLQPIPYPPTQKVTGPTTEAAPEIASDKELKEVSEALFKKESNTLSKYVTVNYQGKTSSFSKDDLAPQPLLTLKPEIWNEPIVAAMKTLLDNYEQDVTVNEFVTPLEKNEENEFLDAVMATPVMRHLMVFLKEKGAVSPDPKLQKDFIKQIWFNMYSRGQGKIGSSGFEHIFLSEIKNNEISGLHNWLYFSTLEAKNLINYLGYIKKLDINDKSSVLKVHFTFKGIDKPVDSLFVGTSPELELALYSLCFVTRADKTCPLSLGGQQFNLRTHTFRYRSKNMIGSAFPEI